MQRLALAAARGHPIVMIGGERCVVDTGSPICFRRRTALTLDCQRTPVVADYFGLDRAALTRLIGAPFIGLIAGDILGTLDTEFDSAKGALTASRERLDPAGVRIPIEDFRIEVRALPFACSPEHRLADQGPKEHRWERKHGECSQRSGLKVGRW